MTQKGFAPIFILFAILTFSVLVVALYLTGQISHKGNLPSLQPTVHGPSITLPPSSIETQAKSSVLDNFLLLVGADMKRDASGYQIKESFIPKIVSESEKTAFQESNNQEKLKNSIYKIETVDNDSKRETYYSQASYCTSGNDVCNMVSTEEIPLNSQGTWNSVFIPVNSNLKSVNFYIDNVLVKSITRKEPSLKIISLTKKPSSHLINWKLIPGYELNWKIENPANSKTWIILEYLSSPTKWQYAFFGDSEEYKNYFVDPKTIQSTLENIDFRLIVTDGFNTDVWVEKNLITASKDRGIELFLSGIDDRDYYVIGQGENLELSFFDPETGVECRAKGCLKGENKDKYDVVWSSDKQTICPGDVGENGFYYVFKKEGYQTIKVQVQHKDKPYLKAEKSIKVKVQSDGSYFEDKNPNCSSL